MDRIAHVLDIGCKSAVWYVEPKWRVKITRKSFKYGHNTKNKDVELLVTCGRPNYLEQKFVKDCLKAGVKFPVKKIQYKWFKPKEN